MTMDERQPMSRAEKASAWLRSARRWTPIVVVKDWRVAGMIEDVGESAKHLRRPGVQALIALVSLQENLNATTATGRLMMSLLASVCKE
jgi:hypothetical protein